MIRVLGPSFPGDVASVMEWESVAAVSRLYVERWLFAYCEETGAKRWYMSGMEVPQVAYFAPPKVVFHGGT